jgi:hypothetical protein
MEGSCCTQRRAAAREASTHEPDFFHEIYHRDAGFYCLNRQMGCTIPPIGISR